MVSIKAISASLLGLVSLAVAQTSNFCTSADVCLTANVPATSGSQDLFLQIKAPTNSGWAGVGIGSQMRGSLIFLLYPNTNRNNVTVSPRLGRGNVMPEYESSIKFNLLPGTGIVDGNWVANIRCENCRSWSGGSINVNSNAQPFIWAVGTGQSIASDSPSARINQHATRSVFSLDLVKATGGNSANPFADNTGNNNTGGNNGGGNNDTNNGGEDLGGSAPLTKADKVLIAHGVLMATSFLILYPFGAFVIRFLANRLSSPVPLHASIQILTFVITILGISLGIWVSDMNLTHFEYPRHQVFGIVIFILLFFQIPLGYFHHIMYLKTGGRTLISHLHLWNGRAVIACGIVNGGLGLHAAGIKKDVQGVEIGKVEKYWVVVYAVVAGVVGAMYLGAWVAKLVLGSKKGQEGKQGSNGDARYQKRESERDGVMGYE